MRSSDTSGADRHFDLIVVGGGIVGLGHALAGLRAGLRVALLERDLHARSASVRNFGMIWPIGQPAGEPQRTALRGRELWMEWAARAGFACRATGSLHMAYADDEWRVLQEFVATSSLPGLELRGPEQVRARQPAIVAAGLRGALFSPLEANVDPPAAVGALHAWLGAQPRATVRRGLVVTRVEPGLVTAADGTLWRAPQVVICSGDDLRTLFPEALAATDVTRCKLQMLALEPDSSFHLGPMLAAGLTLLHYKSFADCPSLAALRARYAAEFSDHLEHGVHVLVSQGDDGRLIVGDSHVYGLDFAPGASSRIEALILGYLRRFLAVDPTRVLSRWTGSYALRRGGEPVLRLEPLPGVQVVTALGGSGMTRSLAVGEQTIAALVGAESHPE